MMRFLIITKIATGTFVTFFIISVDYKRLQLTLNELALAKQHRHLRFSNWF